MKARSLLIFVGSFILLLTVAMVMQPSEARYQFYGTTYTSTASTWIQRTPVNSPSARKNHKMAYDSARGVSVLFGGDDGTQILSDTWEWDGTTWTQRTPPTSPPARYHHALAYDSARNVVVLFGGRTADDVILGDTWEWDGTTWTQRPPPTSPPARWIHAMAYDSSRGVVVLFGGSGDCGGSCNDTWEWNGTTWTQRTPSTSPPSRWGHNMAYDSIRGVTVSFGGRNNVFSLDYTWEWNGTTWTQRTSSPSPSARDNPPLAFDSVHGVTVLFGGFSDEEGYLGDTWEWDGTVWADTSPPSTSPSARDNHAMVYDSVRGVTVLFGGNIGNWPFVRLADTWEYGQLIDLGFRPNPDGYNFQNTSQPVPSWSVFKQTFANSDLEYPGGIPKPLAWLFYQTTYRNVFSGVCDGMSSTSIAYYEAVETRPSGATTTFELSPSAAWPLIDLYHGRQLSKGLQNYRNNLWRNNPGVDNVYNQIKSQLPVLTGDPVVMSFVPGPNNSIPANQRFGHSVIPYRLEEQVGSWGKIYVYDPNFPEDSNRYFYFNFQTTPHSFDYDMGFPIPSGSGGNYHVRSGDGWVIELTPLSQFTGYDAKVLHDGFIGWLLGAGEVVHSNSIGQQLGYVQGVLTSTISNSAPMYQWISPGFNANALGFSLPVGEYQAAISYTSNYEYVAASPTTTVDIRVQGVVTP